jgi:hypothetical protein
MSPARFLFLRANDCWLNSGSGLEGSRLAVFYGVNFGDLNDRSRLFILLSK